MRKGWLGVILEPFLSRHGVSQATSLSFHKYERTTLLADRFRMVLWEKGAFELKQEPLSCLLGNARIGDHGITLHESAEQPNNERSRHINQYAHVVSGTPIRLAHRRKVEPPANVL